ncbi:MAG: hypothetical protein ACRDC4_05090 [Plesiomonas sp.]
MFGKKKDMAGVVEGFTKEAQVILDAQKKLAEDKQAEINAAQAEMDAALNEAAAAEAFINNIAALAKPAAAE